MNTVGIVNGVNHTQLKQAMPNFDMLYDKDRTEYVESAWSGMAKSISHLALIRSNNLFELKDQIMHPNNFQN
jgi:hypothetical protein